MVASLLAVCLPRSSRRRPRATTAETPASAAGFYVFERSWCRALVALVKGGAELVQGYALALRLGATVDDIAGGLYAFPTTGEAVHYAAEAAVARTAVVG